MRKGSKTYKVIIDSNVWISFLIGKDLKGLQNLIDSQDITIITSNEQLLELSEVFKRSKIRKYFSKAQITEFFELFDESSEKFVTSTITNLCRDPKDNYPVSLAIDSKADYLITGDKDLLELNPIGETIVLNYSEFDKIVKR